jgi:hypothetical protein
VITIGPECPPSKGFGLHSPSTCDNVVIERPSSEHTMKSPSEATAESPMLALELMRENEPHPLEGLCDAFSNSPAANQRIT